MLNILKSFIHSKPLKMITYEEYMNIALYHPQYGYYMRQKEKIGTKGDFITTSNYSDIMGRIFAKWFEKVIKKYSLPAVFCEIGAGTGRFAKAFMEEWYKEKVTDLTYIIIEKSPYHIKQQSEQFDLSWNVKYEKSLEDLKGFSGMVFSNELFDAFPVHVIEKRENQLFEVMIGIENGRLIENLVPLTNKIILKFIDDYHVTLLEGQRIEICLKMEEMILQISHVLQKGLVVTVDYGYTQEEWKEPLRKDGSLRGYYQHRLITDLLSYPGEMDITSHIHWDVFEQIGRKYHLQKINKWPQQEFFIDIGILEELKNHQDQDPFSEASKLNRAIRSLIMPQGISDAFQVLLQQKDLK
jgi:SAM-dependent MidA family methyltransferase